MILNSIYALMATFSFGILFNIRGKKLIFACMGGGVGWLCLLLLQEKFKLSPTFSLFAASIMIGIYSEVMARVLKSPVTTFAVCAIIPMVPGNGMYYTMYESINGNVSKALSTGIQTLASAGAIAVGIVLVSSGTKIFNVKKATNNL
ncbi:MAG: threonine/serine exporter family protein [Clostridiaceae bacterium]|nr:threonine/serine exporter family protein [Clostridiaceae bacterium]